MDVAIFYTEMGEVEYDVIEKKRNSIIVFATEMEETRRGVHVVLNTS